MLAALAFLIYRPILAPIRLGGDNAENFRDTVDRNTLNTIFDPFLITTSLGANTYFCPMQSIVWLGLARLLGPRSAFYRIFALLVHIMCAILAANLARSLLSSSFWGATAGAMFLFFAYHAATVGFVSAVITHGLCVIFYLSALLAFYAYLKTRKAHLYLVVFLFFVLAHLSKETAWSLLPVMMALEYFVFLPAERKRLTFDNVISFANKYWPFAFVLLAAMSVFVLKYPYGNIAQTWGGTSLSINVLFRFFDLATMFVVPPVKNMDFLRLVVLNLTIFGLAAIVFYGNARLRFFTLWIALSILPYCMSNFRPTESLSRYLYLASVPFGLLVCHGAKWAREKSTWWRAIVWALPFFLVLLNLSVTYFMYHPKPWG
jgi:hypothetical protein